MLVTRAEDERTTTPETGREVTTSDAPRSLDLDDADLADARAALEVAEKKASRHLIWALLGLSPAALIPFIGLVAEGSFNLIGPLIALVLAVEGGRYALAHREAQRLREVLKRLRRERGTALLDPADKEAP